MTDEDVAVGTEDAVAEAEEELSEEEQELAKLKEAITVEQTEIGPLRIKLTVTVPQDTVNERRSDEYAELKRDATIPGFRKGHAPLALVEKRFAGDVGEQIKSQLLSRGYLAAIEKQDLKPLGDPLFWVTVKEERPGNDGKPHSVETEKLVSFEDAIENIKMPREGSLAFSCEVELKPEFDLPKLEKIPVQRPKIGIGDDDVNAEVERLRMMRGTFQPLEKGAIETDDLLYADMKLSVEAVVVTEEENFELAARDLRVKGIPLIGFGDAVTGKKSGDRITMSAAIPEDHENIDFRGKQADFEFVIKEIKRLRLPELNDEFISTLGFENSDDLRSTVRSSLESRLDATIKEAMRDQIGRHLMDNTKLEIPDGLSQRQTDRSVTRRMIEMYQGGVPQAEIEKNLDELKTKAHDQTVRDLTLFFILEKIAEEREIEVGEEAMNNAIAQIAQRTNKRFDRVRDELSKGEGLTVLYHKLRDQQVLDDLLDDAEIAETEGPEKKTETKPKKQRTASPKKEATKKKSEPSTTAMKAPAKKTTAKKTTAKKSAKRSS